MIPDTQSIRKWAEKEMKNGIYSATTQDVKQKKTKNFSFDKKINSFYANSDAAFWPIMATKPKLDLCKVSRINNLCEPLVVLLEDRTLIGSNQLLPNAISVCF